MNVQQNLSKMKDIIVSTFNVILTPSNDMACTHMARVLQIGVTLTSSFELTPLF